MKTERIHIKISVSDKQLIDTRAKQLDLTISEYLRRLAIIDIEKNKN